jgi:hypothetical protein
MERAELGIRHRHEAVAERGPQGTEHEARGEREEHGVHAPESRSSPRAA